MATPVKPKYLAHCIDCGASAGWIEGRGRVTLRCVPCGDSHLIEYNRLAQRKHRLTKRLARAVKV